MERLAEWDCILFPFLLCWTIEVDVSHLLLVYVVYIVYQCLVLAENS